MNHRMTWLTRAMSAGALAAVCAAGSLTLGGCVAAAIPMLAPGAGVAIGNALSEKPKTKLAAMQVTIDQPSDSQLKCPELEVEKLRMAQVIANAGVVEVPIIPDANGSDTKAAITSTAVDVGTEAAKNVAVSSMGSLGGIGAGVAGGMKQQNAQAQAQSEKLSDMRLHILATQAVSDAQKRTEKITKLQKQRKCAA